MQPAELGFPVARINSGEIAFADTPTVVHTTLGSCVAIAFTDPVTKTGAMCHAALPWAPVTCADPFRYVDESLIYMVGRFERLGVPRKRLIVKLFGGADVLNASGAAGPTVGAQNIAATMSMLEHHGIRPVALSTGGRLGRNVAFVSHTAEVYVRMLKKTLLAQVEERP